MAIMAHQIDLHGLTVDAALETFVEQCNRLFRGGYRGKIVVVHGYGSSGQGGAIKKRLTGFLAKHHDYFDSSVWDGGNPGVTTLRQLKALPVEKAGGIEQQLLAFLVVPKVEAKIFARFHSKSVAEVKELLRDLRQRGLIHEAVKNGQKAWQCGASSGKGP